MLFLLLLPFLEALLLFALDYYIIHTDAHALMKWFNVSTKRFFFFFYSSEPTQRLRSSSFIKRRFRTVLRSLIFFFSFVAFSLASPAVKLFIHRVFPSEINN